ncbi:MAG: hypothetical protein RPU64_10780 [Candidatus Sedimenticola sp. (ex Thyasira tokunagai)]
MTYNWDTSGTGSIRIVIIGLIDDNKTESITTPFFKMIKLKHDYGLTVTVMATDQQLLICFGDITSTLEE